MDEDDDLPAIRERLRHLDNTVSQIAGDVERLTKAEERRAGREEALAGAAAEAMNRAHERGAWARLGVGFLPWAINGGLTLLVIYMTTLGGTP